MVTYQNCPWRATAAGEIQCALGRCIKLNSDRWSLTGVVAVWLVIGKNFRLYFQRRSPPPPPTITRASQPIAASDAMAVRPPRGRLRPLRETRRFRRLFLGIRLWYCYNVPEANVYHAIHVSYGFRRYRVYERRVGNIPTSR